jgi:hypothetical protein
MTTSELAQINEQLRARVRAVNRFSKNLVDSIIVQPNQVGAALVFFDIHQGRESADLARLLQSWKCNVGPDCNRESAT